MTNKIASVRNGPRDLRRCRTAESPLIWKELRITMRRDEWRKKKLGQRGLSLGLCALMLAACILPCAAAEPIGDGVVPLYDEAYYAMTDYYGNLTDGSVVKSYITNGVTTITDYGQYDQVNNLTDGTAPTTADGKTVFRFTKVPGHFYFEGKTAKPFEQLPWTLSVHYTLNGLPVKAEELAGAKGVVEINVDAIPNESTSEYARNNYTLEAMAIFNQDDILSLEAPGAQVQLVGNLRAVLFLAFPGEEGHFTIRVGAEDFSFGGMTFLMVPATLSQLEEISKLSDRKDELEDDYHKLSDSLDVLLDSLNDMSGSLYASANGLDKLNQARGTISGGKDKVYDAADAVRGDLDAIAAALQPVSGQIDAASTAVSDSKTVLSALTGEVTALRSDLKKLEELIDDVQDHQGDMEDLFDQVVSMKGDLRDLEDALNAAKKTKIESIEPLFGGKSSKELEAALTQVEKLNGVFSAVDKDGSKGLDFTEFMAGAMLAGGKAADANTAAATAATVEDTYAKFQAAGCKSSSDVKNAVYMQYYGKIVAAAKAQGMSDEQAAAYAESLLAEGGAQYSVLVTDQTKAVTAWETRVSMRQCFEAAGGSDSHELTKSEFAYAAALAGGENAKTAASLKQLAELNEADPGLTKLLIMEADSLNEKVDSLNGTISSAKKQMDNILGPTADVVGKLADLCKDLDDLDDLLDTADDFGDLGKSVSKKLIAVLDQVDALYQVLDGYEPKLQETLTTVKQLTETAAVTVQDTSSFMGSLEDLMKTSGKQLDNGTKQTLEGLAATLRAAGNSMKKTNDVKAAKSNISSIIEDTWDEYTGDVNNLLLMDANAEAESLTDSRNAAPTTVQVLIRTQEIKADEGGNNDVETVHAQQTTFWGRVAQMFKDLWAAITGVFHKG